LRVALRIVFGIDIGIDYAGGGARVVRGCPPRTVEQFDSTQLLQGNTAPVGRRSRRLETAFALAAVLITEDSKPALPVPPQPVWTEQARMFVINSRNRPPPFYRRILLAII
jgi:hypothetical protein